MKNVVAIFIIFWAVSFMAYSQNYKVIVNKNNPVNELSRKQISNYFLKKKTRWPDKTIVYPVDLYSRSKVRAKFSAEIHRKSTSKVRVYWQQAIFAGKATPPPELRYDADVIKYVKRNRGAIGYVSANANTKDVKVIKIK